MARQPVVLWAQRSEKVYLTVEVMDAKNAQVNLETEGRFTFSAVVGVDNQKFEADLELFGAIDVEKSLVNKGQRHTTLLLVKKEAKWWPRLLKAEGKSKFIKADWNRWVDEDDEHEAPESNFDMGGMGGMDFSNMSGMDDQEDMAEEDEEDFELPTQETESAVQSERIKTEVEVKPEGGAQESTAADAAKI